MPTAGRGGNARPVFACCPGSSSSTLGAPIETMCFREALTAFRLWNCAPLKLLNGCYTRSDQMSYTDPRQPDRRRFDPIRRISMGQWIGLVVGACAVAFGIYFVFSYV